jgi:predicted outer membrane repeat protein
MILANIFYVMWMISDANREGGTVAAATNLTFSQFYGIVERSSQDCYTPLLILHIYSLCRFSSKSDYYLSLEEVIMRYCLFLLPLFLITVFSQTLHAYIIHVPSDSITIQGGINGAVDGDTVMVSPGIYYEYDIDFLGKGITVTGTDPEDSAVVAATVVHADSLGRVFIFQSGEDSASVLAGLTITGGQAYDGGGVYCNNASPTIRDNIITANSAIGGGGILCDNSNPQILNNLISENSADSSGGGIYCNYSSPTISNNIITGNSAIYTKGGGIHCYASSPFILNNIIANNLAGSPGGALGSGWNSQPTITNNTITGNSADTCGGIWCYDSGPTIKNCILWGNSGEEISGGNPVITYSDIQGGWGGEGNIDEDPLFFDPSNGDYHLQLISPCVDTGDTSINDSCRPPGLGEERSDMGAYGGEENCGWPPFNHDPVITSSPDTVAIAGLEYIYDVEAEDPDGDSLYFTLLGAPSWLSIDTIAGVITGIPPFSAIGDTTVTVLVEDGFGGSDSQTFPLYVIPQINLSIIPGEITIPRGTLLEFDTHIQNYRENPVEGDYWLTVLLPTLNEVLIPEGLLNYSNPLHGQVFPYSHIELSNQLFVPSIADTGSYQLIGRIGLYPDEVIDEESFGFRVVE